ncbi:hypothetical protein AB0I68_16680, partial [Streptomyces sp. NPDC050448]|uniref:hypothetical protein n=1 Tax=Streptomyces sp. NPDC050448 TaxID=3155404 RepID=UPI003412577D
MIFSFNASSESAALIECFVIPSPGSASPIKLAFFADLPANPDQTTTRRPPARHSPGLLQGVTSRALTG